MNIQQELSQSTPMGMIFQKTFTRLTGAILALTNRCLALAWCMRLLGVVCFCEHRPLKLSRTKFVLDFSMPARLNALLSIYPQCTAFYCSSSSAQSWPYPIGLSRAHPKSIIKLPKCSGPTLMVVHLVVASSEKHQPHRRLECSPE